MLDLHATALALHDAGFSPVPVAADGTKRPRIAWKPYTEQAAGRDVVDGWFSNPHLEQGVGVITGVGGLELLEVEGRGMARMGEVVEVLDGTGLRPLYDRILRGWSEQSPSGGIHLLYRVEGGPVPGNTKVAQRPVDNPPYRETIAETRGTGGFVVTAPSQGRVHDTGRPYVLIGGGPASCAVISVEDRETLHAVFASVLDEMPAADEPGPVAVNAMWDDRTPRVDGDIMPGEEYERTDWIEILEPAGWVLVFTRGRTRYWRRPGKRDGISATTGHADDRDRLYVFTSSSEFEPEVPYTKFGAFAVLKYHGDHGAAAKALAADGYGHRAERVLAAPSAESARTTTTGTTIAAVTTDAAQTKPVVIGSDKAALTDLGNAQLLVAAYADRLRYVPDAGKWVQWDGSRWEWQPDDGAAIEAAKDVIERIPTDNDALAAHRVRSMTARRIGDATRLARTVPAMRIRAAEFDQHPWQLNTPGGIVDLRTGDVAAPLPSLHHSRRTMIAADSAAATPMFDRFLQTTFQGHDDLLRYVQRLAGLSAIGEAREHILPFLHGPGGNGKSVLMEVLTSILGDYATEAPPGFLIAGRDKHETELANLQGRRLVVASEINENTRFDEAKMKLLTGGDKITARFMKQDFFTFKPSHTIWLLGNNQPKVETGGHSFWRRLRLIPFTHTVPEAEKIEGLSERLVAEEGPGILSWIIQGAVDYAAGGLRTPGDVLAATDTYRAEEDHLGRFVEDRCVVGGEQLRVEMGELRRVYDQWCRDQGENEISGTAFGRQLKQKVGVGTAKSNGRRYYTGLGLAAVEDESDDADNGEWWDR